MVHGIDYPEDLAEQLGNLQYDVLAKFLTELAEKIKKDSEADAGRGRPKLSKALSNASLALNDAASEILQAWKNCKPYVN